MRTFLLKLAAFLSLQLAAFALLLSDHDGLTIHYLSSTADKHYVAQTALSPRLIFAGGSSGTHAIDSPAIHAATGRCPVNLTLYLNLGLNFMLAEARSAARPGDVIVLCLEWEHYIVPEIPAQQTSAFQMIVVRPQTAQYLSMDERKRLLDNGMGLLHNLINDARKSRRSNPLEATRIAFNYYGDRLIPESIAPTFRSPTFPPVKRIPRAIRKIVEEAVDKLNRYAASCAETGIDVVVIYPPYDEVAGDLDFKPLLVHEVLTARFNGAVLGTPRDMFLPESMLFDSPYHPTREGKQRYTKRLLKYLSPYLKRRGAVSTDRRTTAVAD